MVRFDRFPNKETSNEKTTNANKTQCLGFASALQADPCRSCRKTGGQIWGGSKMPDLFSMEPCCESALLSAHSCGQSQRCLRWTPSPCSKTQGGSGSCTSQPKRVFPCQQKPQQPDDGSPLLGNSHNTAKSL